RAAHRGASRAHPRRRTRSEQAVLRWAAGELHCHGRPGSGSAVGGQGPPFTVPGTGPPQSPPILGGRRGRGPGREAGPRQAPPILGGRRGPGPEGEREDEDWARTRAGVLPPLAPATPPKLGGRGAWRIARGARTCARGRTSTASGITRET